MLSCFGRQHWQRRRSPYMCAEVDLIHVKIGIEIIVKVEMNTIIVRHQENFTKIYTNGIKQEYKLMQVKYYI